MRQHKNSAIKVVATTVALFAVAACGSSGSGGGSSSGGPVPGASTTITAVGSAATGGGGGGGNPYSTGPMAMGTRSVTARANPYFFTPTPDTVSAGSTVTFVFQDVNHTVTFDTPGSPANISSAAAGGVANADSTRVFPTAGTYSYHCSIHPYMTGMVIVQ